MLSGRTPFTGENYPDIAFKHIREPLPSLRTLCPDLPTVLELVVDRALHHNPQNRFQTAGEFIAAYSQAISKHSRTIYPTSLQRERQTQPLPAAVPPTQGEKNNADRPAHEQAPTDVTTPPDQISTLYPKNKEIITMIDDFRKKMERFQTRSTSDTEGDHKSSSRPTHFHQ
jgi:hypothetical protein